MDYPAEVYEYLLTAGFGTIRSAEKLEGGLISLTRRLTLENGTVVLKQCANPPIDLYDAEADGLEAVTVPGGPRVPRVLHKGPGHILLEDLGKSEPGPGYWEKFGRQVALLHSQRNTQYGFHRDNYLGILLMDNAWSDNGYEFFARTRILRFLFENKTMEHLSAEDVGRVEGIAKRLPDLIPYQPPSLLHGDLWTSNMVADSKGEPCIIDPGAYYGWPEAELSMTAQYSGVDPAFFDAYREVNPLESGWEERFELLKIREQLSMIAHCGNDYGTVGQLRELLGRFA